MNISAIGAFTYLFLECKRPEGLRTGAAISPPLRGKVWEGEASFQNHYCPVDQVQEHVAAVCDLDWDSSGPAAGWEMSEESGSPNRTLAEKKKNWKEIKVPQEQTIHVTYNLPGLQKGYKVCEVHFFYL